MHWMFWSFLCVQNRFFRIKCSLHVFIWCKKAFCIHFIIFDVANCHIHGGQSNWYHIIADNVFYYQNICDFFALLIDFGENGERFILCTCEKNEFYNFFIELKMLWSSNCNYIHHKLFEILKKSQSNGLKA